MKILYQNVVPYRGYEAYAAAQKTVAERWGLTRDVKFAWLNEPTEKFPDGSPAEMERIDLEVVGKLQAADEEYDYLVVGCALDSGIEVLWRDHRLRAYGAGEILYRLAAWQGHNFAVVLPERSMIPQYEYLLRRYQTLDTFMGFASLDLSNPEMIGDPQRVVGRLRDCIRGLDASRPLDEVVVACTLASANLAAHSLQEIDGVAIPNLISVPLLFCRMLAEARSGC
jgi:Asp/Glu/hydantoin racemase